VLSTASPADSTFYPTSINHNAAALHWLDMRFITRTGRMCEELAQDGQEVEEAKALIKDMSEKPIRFH
jgi:hypothetical protein